jgi:hypothetical protein
MSSSQTVQFLKALVNQGFAGTIYNRQHSFTAPYLLSFTAVQLSQVAANNFASLRCVSHDTQTSSTLTSA